MASIIRGGKTIEFNRIVSYGCSFTAGDELGEHLFCSPPMTIEELDALKRAKKHNNQSLDVTIRRVEYNKTLAWPNYIAAYFGVPILNRALPGSSLNGILFRIFEDLHDKSISDDDLILVGLTSIARITFFKDDINSKTWPWPGFLHLGVQLNWPSKRLYYEYVEHLGGDYTLMNEYYQQLKLLDLLSINLGGRLLIQYAMPSLKDILKWKSTKLSCNNFIKMLQQTDNLQSQIDPTVYISSKKFGYVENDPSCSHGYGHPHVRFHKLFADHLISKLIKGT